MFKVTVLMGHPVFNGEIGTFPTRILANESCNWIKCISLDSHKTLQGEKIYIQHTYQIEKKKEIQTTPQGMLKRVYIKITVSLF